MRPGYGPFNSRHLACVLMTAGLLFMIPAGMLAESVSETMTPTWKVLVYLDADNDLDTELGFLEASVVQTDLNELMEVGSTENVDAFVLVDRFDGPANMYQVYPGDLDEVQDYWFQGEEVNMGDPVTLRTFVSCASNMSEAQYTALIFWDHGTPYYIALDDNTGVSEDSDPLTHKEVIEAIRGYNVDLLGADECLVGQVEVAYEYATKTDIDYLVASECYTGWRGLEYDEILRAIDECRDITPRELSIAITEMFNEFFANPPYMNEIVNSKAAIDLAMMTQLTGSLNALTDLLMPDLVEYYGAITAARGYAEILYGCPPVSRFDLGAFVERLSEKITSPQVKQACSDFLEDYSATVIGLGVTKTTEDFHTGLGIFFPTNENHDSQEAMLEGSLEIYFSYSFPGEGWEDFLRAYWDGHAT